MKVFVLAGSFIESIIINMLEYLLNKNIDQIMLVEENHSYDEKLIKHHPNIVLCKNIEEGIVRSDMCVIIKNKYLSDFALAKVRIASEKKKKQLVELTYDFGQEQKSYKEMDLKQASGVPSIFNISIGEFHSCVQTEIALHTLFSKMNLNVYYDFSKSAKNFLLQTNKSKDFSAQEMKKYDVFVFTQHYDTLLDIFKDYSLLQNFIALNPDCLLLNVEAGFSAFDTLENIFKYRCNKQIDQYIISDFFHTSSFTKEYRPVCYIKNYNKSFQEEPRDSACNIEQGKFVFANDKDFFNKLRLRVVSKIALPQDIRIV